MEIYLHALTSYFVIIDPIGTAVIFHGLTGGAERAYVRRMALRSVLISTAIVLLFGFFGESLLTSLGISIASLRVAGGFLLFYTAFNMITRQGRKERRSQLQTDISVYPLSIPLIAGPGCLTLTILLFSQGGTLQLTAAVLTIYLATLAAFLGSGKIHRLIGETGDDILRRLLGVVLAALAVQFIADGIRQLAG
ncbi:MAG TPA: MarC family protein [Desulfuromonadales bacterium]|nr:MarC family protein [Desulfuromonadales bacterium]